jgi:hypothetical protein
VSTTFVPVNRMLERAQLARDESDTSYFFELLYLGELIIKVIVVEILAAMDDDPEQYRHALEYRLVHADGIGEWAEAFDEALTGPSSQYLIEAGRESQRAFTSTHGPGSESWQRHAVDLLTEARRLLDPSVADMSQQKVSLRQWARDFASLRNRTRGHGAPKPEILSQICPRLESSINLIIESVPAFQRDWAFLRRSLSGKYRVSPFGGSRGPFRHLSREANHSLPDGAYAFLGEPRQAKLLFSDPDLNDFYLPNGTFRGKVFEVFSYITDERHDEDGSIYLLPAYGRPDSETAAKPDLDVVGNSWTNMPPSRSDYIERSSLESELAELLTDDRHPLITLQGTGGVGKTSLALTVLHRIAATADYYIIWFSARDIDLLPEGPRVVRPNALSVDDFANDFSALMRPGQRVKKSDAESYLTNSLSGQSQDGPFIFVFDNFETIRQQAELFAYLSNAIRLPNKVLITTRTRDFKADYPIEVHGMTREEFSQLVNEASTRLKISSIIDSPYEEQLFEESGGHPYITKILLGEIAKAGKQVTLKRIIAAKDVLLDALFDRSFAALSATAQRIFLTLCSWRSLIPRIGLEAVLLRPGNDRIDVEHALTELEQSSLIERTSSDDGDGDFLSVPLVAAIFGRKRLVTSPMKIAIDADIELLQGFGTTTTTDLIHGLPSRIDRLTRAIAARAEQGSDLAPELAILEYIASKYPYAWLKLADLYEEISQDSSQAIHAVSRYLEEFPEDSTAWRRLIRLHVDTNNILGEINARFQLVELPSSTFNDLSSTANRVNSLFSQRAITLDADERRLTVAKLQHLMEARVSEASATDLSRLAWLCLYGKDHAAAEHWAAEGLQLDPQNEHCKRLTETLSRE